MKRLIVPVVLLSAVFLIAWIHKPIYPEWAYIE